MGLGLNVLAGPLWHAYHRLPTPARDYLGAIYTFIKKKEEWASFTFILGVHARGVRSKAHQNRGVVPPPDPLHHPGGGCPGAAGARRQAAVKLHYPPLPSMDRWAPAPTHVWDRGAEKHRPVSPVLYLSRTHVVACTRKHFLFWWTEYTTIGHERRWISSLRDKDE